jgi:hypothetical protein
VSSINIAICHYHLNRGGVNQVIANHIAALASCAGNSPVPRVAILYGGRREGWHLEKTLSSSVSLLEVEGLDYDASSVRCRDLAGTLRATLKRIGFSPADTVLHVHNHALGKNVSFPGALAELARDGFGLLLHIHDFAEDFRPGNYNALRDLLARDRGADLPRQLYPSGGRIHYAVLNQRDRQVLETAGLRADRLHWLPNPVTEPRTLPDRGAARDKLSRNLPIQPDDPLLVYPVRGIRRKNLGEALLWAALAAGRARVAITLPPLNPLEQISYERWRTFAETCRLPCEFEFGERSGLSFPEVQSAADRVLTTSVAEGFGMVFLETWLVQRSLVGRDLPEITADFVDSGIRLDNLRAELPIPVDWVGKASFQEAIETAFVEVLRDYQQPVPPQPQLHLASQDLIKDGWVDFAMLSSLLQQSVIERILADRRARDRMHQHNPWIAANMNPGTVDEAVVAHNVAAVREAYSLARSGERLMDTYLRVLASPGDTGIGSLPEAGRILPRFLQMSRFHPIRTER